MPTETARRHARSALYRLARADMDNDTFQFEAAAVLDKAIGFDWLCWTLLDPATGLPGRAISVNSLVGGDPRRFWQLIGDTWHGGRARSASGAPEAQPPVTVLSAVTGGDLRRDRCWRELFGPAGTGDTLRAQMAVDRTGWAMLHMARDSSGSWFGDAEAALVAEVAPLLATRLRDGLRAASRAVGRSGDPLPCPGPGTIVLDRELALVSATYEAWQWIDRIGMQRLDAAAPFPGFVYVPAVRVATQPAGTARLAAATHPPRTARVRVQAADGRWVVVQAAALTPGPGSGQAGAGYAITLEAARSDDLAPLLMRAWALSPRERDVARLVIDGLSSEDIAAALFISPHTVGDHLKAIFGKLDIHRRRDLVAALAGASAVPAGDQP